MGNAFHLHLADDGLATLTFDLPEKKVNVFTREALGELDVVLGQLHDRDDIAVLVLLSGKSGNFIAGLDVQEIATVSDPEEVAAGVRLGQELFQRWSRLPFPTVAAIQGACMGGGTEWVLASDHAFASDRTDIRIGLPEVRLGIIPAWGGCTRLPRRIGATAALEIILGGKSVGPRRALELGLVDQLIPAPEFRPQIGRLALEIATGRRPTARRPGLRSRLIGALPGSRSLIFNQARKRVLAKTGGHYPAPLRAVEVIETGVRNGLEAGLAAEVRATSELAVGPVCKNLMHVFQLMETKRHRKSDAKPRSIDSAAVLGAGTMGGGIAQLIAGRAGIPVRLKDLSEEPLAQGMAHAARLFENQLRRGWMRRSEVATRMNLLRPTLDYSGFEQVDLVIEAIVENLAIKKEVFAELAQRMPASSVLASNTSSLSIAEIGAEVGAPSRVIGMHFFNPVDRMPLVEIVRTDTADDETIATAFDFAQRLGKTPILVRDSPGFLVNRLLGFCMIEALWLIEEGVDVAAIDRAMTDWGMPLGPLALIDEIGIDVAVEVARVLTRAFGDRLPVPAWVDRLGEPDRLGAKTGKGIYRYSEGERERPDPALLELLELDRPRRKGSPGELVDRLVLPMVDEAARCLEENVVGSPGAIDLGMIMGAGFPPFRGGLCRWADQQGPDAILEASSRFAASAGDRYRPSPALERIMESGGFYPATDPN